MGRIALSANAQNGRTEGFCVVRSIDTKKSSAGSPYLDMVLGDNAGQIRAKLWDYKADVHGAYRMGDVVKVRGRISQWQGSEQLTVDQIRKARDDDNVPMESLVPSAPADSANMYDLLFSLAQSFADEDLKTLTCHLLSVHKAMILRYPAALKLHHAQRGGLLYHTMTLTRLAQAVCEIYPALDRDLLLCGAILHDIAKTRELELAQSGLAAAYTPAGQLLGHLVMGAEWVDAAARELGIDEEKSMLVQHMLISHHGEPEYGAAKLPMFPEAEALSQIDMLDARLFNMFQELEQVAPGEFTQPVWSLDRRRLYNHGRGKKETEDK